MSQVMIAIAVAIALFSVSGAAKVHGPVAPIAMDAIPPSGG